MRVFITLCFGSLISCIFLGCKKENRANWSEITINIVSLTGEKFDESVPFIVAGIKSGDGYITKGGSDLQIEDDIVNGFYEGGFRAKSGSRWRYYLQFEYEFTDSFYFETQYPTFITLAKRKANVMNFRVAKKLPLHLRSFLTGCNGIGDNIVYIMKHKQYQTNIDVSEDSEDWETSGLREGISTNCDTNKRTRYYPAGQYEIGIKTYLDETFVEYDAFEFEIFNDSVNRLELYY